MLIALESHAIVPVCLKIKDNLDVIVRRKFVRFGKFRLVFPSLFLPRHDLPELFVSFRDDRIDLFLIRLTVAYPRPHFDTAGLPLRVRVVEIVRDARSPCRPCLGARQRARARM